MPPTDRHSFKEAGFSLLELLLVILIISVIATFGFTTLHQYADNTRIQQTATQMQTIQQAAAGFFIDTGNWPTTCNDPSFSKYLANASLNNPFGGVISCQISREGKKFAVTSGNLPNQNVAQQLAALLPSAGIQQNAVISEIVVPSRQQTETGNYLIHYIGLSAPMNNNISRSFSFTCPIGWSAQTIISPTNIFATDWYNNFPQACSLWGPGSNLISTLYADNQSCTAQGTQNGQTRFSCSYGVNYVSNRQPDTGACNDWQVTLGGNVAFTEIGYCIPPNRHLNKTLRPVTFL